MKYLFSIFLCSSNLAWACIDVPQFFSLNKASFGRSHHLEIVNTGFGAFTLLPRKKDKGDSVTITWSRESTTASPFLCFGVKGECNSRKSSVQIKNDDGKIVGIAQVNNGVVMIFSVKTNEVDPLGPRLKFFMNANMDTQDHFFVTSLAIDTYSGNQQVGHFEKIISNVTSKQAGSIHEGELELSGFTLRSPTEDEMKRENKIIGQKKCFEDSLIKFDFSPRELN